MDNYEANKRGKKRLKAVIRGEILRFMSFNFEAWQKKLDPVFMSGNSETGGMHMKSFSTIRGVMLLLMLFAAVAAGCGGGSSGSASTADVDGMWTSYHTPDGQAEGEADIWVLTQNGNNITGTGSGGTTSSGTVSGSSVTLTMSDVSTAPCVP